MTRYFSTLPRETLKRITSKGGKTAHLRGSVYTTWDSETAREMGRKGGLETQRKRRMRV